MSGIYKIHCESCDKCYAGQDNQRGIMWLSLKILHRHHYIALVASAKENLRNITNQECDKSPVAEYLLKYIYTIKNIELIKK